MLVLAEPKETNHIFLIGWDEFNWAQIDTVKPSLSRSENWPVILSVASSTSIALLEFPFLSVVAVAPLKVYPDSPDEKSKNAIWPLVGIFFTL